MRTGSGKGLWIKGPLSESMAIGCQHWMRLVSRPIWNGAQKMDWDQSRLKKVNEIATVIICKVAVGTNLKPIEGTEICIVETLNFTLLYWIA